MIELVAAQPQVLRFEAVPHQYFLDPDGYELPSVTNLLKDAGLIDYSMIPQDVLYAASLRGTAVHRAAELYDHDRLDETSLEPHISGHLGAIKNYYRDTGFVPAYIEHRVWHRTYLYAGTLDRTGMFPDGSMAIVDFKTGTVFPAHRLQLAAYLACLPDPRRFRRIALSTSEDGTYRAHEFPVREYKQDLDVFLAALALRNWRAKHAA